MLWLKKEDGIGDSVTELNDVCWADEPDDGTIWPLGNNALNDDTVTGNVVGPGTFKPRKLGDANNPGITSVVGDIGKKAGVVSLSVKRFDNLGTSDDCPVQGELQRFWIKLEFEGGGNLLSEWQTSEQRRLEKIAEDQVVPLRNDLVRAVSRHKKVIHPYMPLLVTEACVVRRRQS